MMENEKDHRIRINQEEQKILVEALDLLWKHEEETVEDFYRRREGIRRLRHRILRPGESRIRRGYQSYH